MPWDKCLTRSNRRIPHTGRFCVACTIVLVLIQHVIAIRLAWPNYAWRTNMYYFEGVLSIWSLFWPCCYGKLDFGRSIWVYEYMGLQEFRLFQILRVPVADLASEINGLFKGPVVIYSSSNLASLVTMEWVWSGLALSRQNRVWRLHSPPLQLGYLGQYHWNCRFRCLLH